MAKKSKYYVRPDGLRETIRTINGKRVAFRGKSDREVDRKILEYREKEAVGRLYKEVLRDWWNSKEPEWSAASQSAYLRACQRVEKALGDKRVKEIRPLDVERYLLWMKEKGYRSGTVGLDISLLKMSFRWAVLHDEIDVSPCTEVRKPKGLYTKKREALTEDQIMAVTNCRDGEWWLFGLMLLYTGCRRGELLALRYEDVDRKAKTIRINKKLNYANGNIPFLEDHTKTDAGMRTIELLPVLEKAIPTGRIGLIFHEPDGEPLKSATLARIWKEYCRTVGFVETDSKGKEHFPITPHCFRHTFATICFDAGVDVKSTSAMLGHADESITMGLYTHLTAGHRKAAGEKLTGYVEKLTEKAL